MGAAEVDPDHADPERDERPPFGSWARIYTVALVFAVACIALLYWFTSAFNIPWPNR
ncbi:MAG: hypothetical protein ACYTGW_18425 [Planctomycetota bacterium]